MCVVVPSIRLHGTAASSTQRKRRKLVTSSFGCGSTQACVCGWAATDGAVICLGANLPPFFLPLVMAVLGGGLGAWSAGALLVIASLILVAVGAAASGTSAGGGSPPTPARRRLAGAVHT